MDRLRNHAPIAVLAMLLAMPVAGQAQGYPNKPVRIIVPYAAGGAVDIVARTIGQKLAETLGEQFVVDNRPGANGVLGTSVAALAPKDGYTLLLVAANHVVNASLYQKIPYDAIRDFAPVGMMGFSRNALAIHPSIPVKSLKELVALAKARPGQLNYASTGSGSPTHLNAELFKIRAGLDIVHLPYKGAPQALSALISGEVALSFLTITGAVPQGRAGRVRVLAVTGEERSPAAPEWPTIAEAGLSGLEANAWIALLAPAGTPREVILLLNAETGKALKAPDVLTRLQPQGVEIFHSTPEHLASAMQADLLKWAEVVKKSGAKLD